MSVFEAPDFDHHETVAFFDNEAAGLRSIIAIHSTALGPACGGTRMYPYANGDDALADVLRLSRGMSYKSAVAGLPLGGGKAVILGDPATDKTETRLLAYAGAVNALGGRYITAMDVGMGPDDLRTLARGTAYVAGFDQPGKTGGNSAPLTALGVLTGLKAAVKHRLGLDRLSGITVAIQGLGKVGQRLAAQLHEQGARLIVADINADAVRRAVDAFAAEPSTPEEIIAADCDVLSLNALGGVLNEITIPKLRARIVAGAANNQLAKDSDAAALDERGILYAPDYVINAGGLICVAGQIFGWDNAEIERRTTGIGETLAEIFQRADRERRPTGSVADAMAEQRIAAAGRLRPKAAE